ncbi:Ig-like domain-containing protein [Alsobacter sp. SYSU BS001988]
MLALSNGASATVTITEAQSGAAGGLAITSAGAVTNARSQTISGTADPSKAGAVVHILDAGPSGTIEIGTATVQANGAWSATAQLSAVEGNHLVSATLDGGSSPAVAYTLDWTPAVVTGTQSVSGLSNKTVETLTIKATDSLAGVKSVEVFDNGVDIGAATLTSAGWSFTTGKLADGAHAFTAAATDKAGNVSAAVSTGAVMTVDTVAPSVVLTDATRATAGAKTATTVFGHAEAGATVTLSANGSVVASGIAADAKGDWSFTSSIIQANRLTTLTAVATDAAGNKGAVSNELVLGTASTDKITDASSGVVFVAGSGADTITGGGGADRFVFHAGFGKDVITNFQPGASATAVHDVIVLDRVIAGLAGISTDSALAAYVLGRTTDTASGVLLQITATDSILLQHVTKSQLIVSDFHLI